LNFIAIKTTDPTVCLLVTSKKQFTETMIVVSTSRTTGLLWPFVSETLLLVPFLFLLLVTPMEGFSSSSSLTLLSYTSVSPRNSYYSWTTTTSLHASTLEEKKKTSSSSSSPPTESVRLSKARLLLEQLQPSLRNEEISIVNAVMDVETKIPQLQPRTDGGSSTTTTTDLTLVPENFWSNGHLDENYSRGKTIVTRWAKGVKVAEPLVKYDPIQAERLLFRQPTKWLVRNVQISFPMGLWAVGVIWDTVTGKSVPNRRARAQQLTRAISGLGPAIIKGGQALASRPDLLPQEYLEELQKLQDDVPRFSNALALQTVERELGIEQFSDVFELVE
jgi:hypothetical protein